MHLPASVSRCTLALAVTAMLSCGPPPTTSQPTPWLKIETRRHRVIFPHMLAVGENGHTLYRRWKGRWQELSTNFAVIPLEGGRVLVRTGQDLLIYQQHVEAPVALPMAQCHDWGVWPNGERIVCARCALPASARPERPPYGQWRECDEYHFTEFDISGQPVRTRVAAFAEEPRWCTMDLWAFKFTSEGDPIISRTCPAQQSGGGWVYTSLAVTPTRVEALPPDAAKGASRPAFEEP